MTDCVFCGVAADDTEEYCHRCGEAPVCFECLDNEWCAGCNEEHWNSLPESVREQSIKMNS